MQNNKNFLTIRIQINNSVLFKKQKLKLINPNMLNGHRYNIYLYILTKVQFYQKQCQYFWPKHIPCYIETPFKIKKTTLISQDAKEIPDTLLPLEPKTHEPTTMPDELIKVENKDNEMAMELTKDQVTQL